jgi:hypothetical protein
LEIASVTTRKHLKPRHDCFPLKNSMCNDCPNTSSGDSLVIFRKQRLFFF